MPAEEENDQFPALHEQRASIKTLFQVSANLKDKEDWYLISNKWWELWQQFVDFEEDDDEKPVIRKEKLGPIQNSDLFEDENCMNLKKNLAENTDFVFLPSPVWKALKEWYGGGPSIKRKVITIGNPGNKRLLIDVYPVAIKISKAQSTVDMSALDDTEFAFSRFSKLREIQMKIGQLNYSAPHKIRLYSKTKTPAGMDEIRQLKDVNITLEEAGLTDGSVVLYETGGTEGWSSGASDPLAGRRFADAPEGETKEYSSSSSASDSGYSGISRMFGGWFSRDERGPRHTSGSTHGKGLAGLNNLGNTCFMNSALQCLSHTPPLTNYFLTDEFKEHVNTTNPLGMQGQLAEQYSGLLKELWSEKYSVVDPSDFKHALGKFATQFSGYQQQDSQELLAFLLDGLHEDLNQVKQKPYVETVESGGRPDSEVAQEAWDKHLQRNKSIIVSHFQGQFRSTVKCPDCNKVSITFDPFMYLSVPLPIKAHRAVEITYVPQDPTKKPVKYICKINKNSKVRELREKFTELSGVSLNEYVIAEIYSNRVFVFQHDDRHMSLVRDNDILFAFEILPTTQAPRGSVVPVATPKLPEPTNEGENKEAPPVNFVVLSSRENNGRLALFGYPLYLSMKGDPAPTTNQMRAYVTRALTERFVIPDAVGKEFDPEKAFTLRYTSFQGNSCDRCGTASCIGCKVETDDCPLKLGDRETINAEWHHDYLRFFDNSRKKTVDIHKSVKEYQAELRQSISLNDCFSLFTQNEKLSAEDAWYCSNCKEHREATKKFDLWKLPNILVIHLKRFQFSKTLRDKIDHLVDFPLKGLDLSPFLVHAPEATPLYDLYAVSNHSGGLGGGHYTASVLGANGRWYDCNDSSVSEMKEGDVVCNEAYVLFYKKRGSDAASTSSPLVTERKGD